LINSIYGTKAKNYRIKKPAECPCLNGWVCEDHPNQPWKHRGCGAAGELCKNPQCDKEPDSVFVLGQPEEENRQLEKLELPERRRFMRLSDSTRPIIFGFILAIGITLIQPYLAAGQSFGRSGTSGASRMQGQRLLTALDFLVWMDSAIRAISRSSLFSSLRLPQPPNLANLPKTEFTFSHAGWTAGMECRS
jgi:hypothetical protein